MMPIRYRVLAIYIVLQAVMQLEWLRFAPITDQVVTDYAVTPSQVGTLSLVFALLFMPLALPTGALIDRISIRASLRIITVSMVLSALLRVLAPSYVFLLAGQIVFAMVQPLTMSLVARLAVVWFSKNEHIKVTELSSMAIFVGVGIAFVLVPMSAGHSVHLSLFIDLAVLIGVALLTFVCVPNDPAHIVVTPTGSSTRVWWTQAIKMLRTAPFVAILIIIFLANGYFAAISTWLEPILSRHHVSPQTTGIVALLMLVGGVVGMVISPALVRRGVTLRGILIAATLTAAATTFVLFASSSIIVLCIAGTALGMMLLSPLPLLIQVIAETAGDIHAGTAVSIFWLAGNAGAVVIIQALSTVANSGRWELGCEILIATLAIQLIAVMLGLRYRQESLT